MITLVSMCRDELDVAELFVRHHFANGIDRMIIADQHSTDGTREVLDKLADEYPVTIIDNDDTGFRQSEVMSRLAVLAWEAGADWVLPADFDEFWYATVPWLTIPEALHEFPAETVFCFGWDHIANGAEADVRQIAYRRADHQQLAKVAFRAAPDAVLVGGNHSVIRCGRRAKGPIAYRHFQYRSFEQMARKVRQGKAAFDETDLHENHGAHWRRLGALDDEALRREWEALCGEPGLVHDPAPILGAQ